MADGHVGRQVKQQAEEGINGLEDGERCTGKTEVEESSRGDDVAAVVREA